MAKNSLELRKGLSLSDFYRLSKQIALYYASTVPTKARSYIMQKYDITESAYYTLLEMAITHHLVDEETASKIQRKVLANQASHGNSGHYSTKKYAELIKVRNNFSAFSKKDIKEIATYFANHSEKSKKQIASFFHFYDSKVLDQLLKKACMELIIFDRVYKKIISRALAHSKDLDYTMKFFSAITQYRNDQKKSKKESTSTS